MRPALAERPVLERDAMGSSSPTGAAMPSPQDATFTVLG
jgi:hypothetical protein